VRSAPPRYAVLVSGRGSNLRAILEASALKGARPTLVVANRADAPALSVARDAGVRALALPASQGEARAAYDERLDASLREAKVEWIVLAGWMRILSDAFVERWAPRILNMHPSLLPSFPGLHPHRQALERGVRVSGCTVHRVEVGPVDGGTIEGQAVVPVLPDDTEATLAARILEAEHRLYPEVLARIFSLR
jgi:phosphoribosylglycinamide formyltransferase-1